MASSSGDRPEPKNRCNGLVLDKYYITGKVGGGSFGDIYKALDVTSNRKVVLKMDTCAAPPMMLAHEYQIYQQLKKTDGTAKVYEYGVHEQRSVMAMEPLGPSLQTLFELCQLRFSLKTVAYLAEQLIERIADFHATGHVHRDIKPDNFVIGRGAAFNRVYLIDFGLAKRFRDPEHMGHIPHRKDCSLVGTLRYLSLNGHLGHEQSRRDDLESLGYMLVYFLKGSLPWQGFKAATKQQKEEMISERKMSTPLRKLCQGLPVEVELCLAYCRHLKFSIKPNYPYLRRLFNLLVSKHYIRSDLDLDWSPHLAHVAVTPRKRAITKQNQLVA